MGRRAVVVVVALAVVASACGTRVSKQETQSAQGQGLGGAATSGDSRPSSSVSGPSGQVMFGTLPSPCGPGDAKGATDVGVTDTEIRITAIADPGGPVPGLNKGMHDSMQAFEKWCNDQGGINGRKVKVDLADAKIFEYQPRVQEACTASFALVGGLGISDGTGAQTQVDCGLPNVPGAVVAPEQTDADLTVQPLPNPQGTYPVASAMWIASNHPDAVQRAAALRTKLAITESQNDRLTQAYEQVGFKFVYKDSSAIGEANWGPFVLAMKNAGVGYMNLTSSYEEIFGLQREMQKQGWKPDVTELETNFYNRKYPQTVGDAADGTYIRLTVWPFEEADQNPATEQYLQALDAAVPGAEPEELGIQSWSAALLWATAVKDLGSNVTRTGLMEKLLAVHTWDGGGLHASGDPGNNKRGVCVIMMQVENGGFVRAFPKPDEDKEIYDAGHGYYCPPDGVVNVTGNWAPGAKKR